ncbi:hypothetical protein Tco_0102964 [Tanacetum coccineum]
MRQEQALQAAHDEKLVTTRDRVKIGKSNLGIDPTITQKEETYYVILDIIKNTPATTRFSLVLMYLKSTCISSGSPSKSPRVPNQEFTVPPSSDSLMDFLMELGYKGQLRHISEMFVDQMHQPWRTLGAIINRCLSGKTSSNDRLRPSRIEILWGHLSQGELTRSEDVRSCPIPGSPKPSYTTSCLNINQSLRDKAHLTTQLTMMTFIGISTGLIPPKKGRDKGAQGTKATVIPKKATSASKKKKQKKKVSISDESSDEESEEQEERLVRKPGLEIDTQKAMKANKRTRRFQHQSGGSSEGAGQTKVSDEPTDKHLQTQVKEYFTRDEKIEDIPWKSTDDDESEDDEEDESDDDKNIDIEKTDDERTDTDVEDQVKGVAEMNIAEEVEEENTERFINSPNASLIGTIPENAEAEINSLLDIQIQQDDPHIQQEPFHVVKELSEKRDYKDVIEESVQANVINQVKNFLPKFLPHAVKEALEKTPPSLGHSSSQGQSAIQAAESLSEYELKKILYEKMHKSKSHLTHDTHQELYDALTWSMLLDEATTKEVDVAPRISKKDWFKEAPRHETLDQDWNIVKTVDTPEQSWFNEMVQAEKPPLTFNELMSTPIDFSAFAMNRLKLNKITRADLVGPMFNLLKSTYKSCVELEYNMEECYRALTYQLDWANPEGHKSPVDMSKPLPLHDKEGRLTIPTPAARYTMEGIDDMIPTLWSPIIISYDKDATLGISHWGPQRQQSGYGYLKEIIVRRADQKLYKFKEGDFSNLHLNDIEDMLIAQNKLFNLDGDVIVDFVTALKMFTRGIIVKNRVEDVQPDKSKKKRLMRVDEIHKFSDGTLQSVRKILRERLLNFKFGYNKYMPLREWTTKDKKRTCITLNKIDDLLFKRRVLRSLEVVVGGRKTESDK